MVPHSARLAALMDAAAKALDAGDDEAAQPLFLQIVGLNPRDADAWHMLALIAIRKGQSGEALTLVKRALGLERRKPVYLNTLGIALAEGGQVEDALQCFKRAVKERPSYAEGHYNLGKAYRKLGRDAEARQSYERAWRLDPAHAEVANNLSTFYSAEGRLDEAIALLREARALRPDEQGFAINLSTALLARFGPEAAIRELAAFLVNHPEAAAVHAWLGRRLLAEGRFEQGWQEYGWRRGGPPVEFPDCAGKAVQLLPDQGLGDHLFFLRFAPALAARAARVAFECPEPLFRLLEREPPVGELRRGSDPPRAFDLSLPLGDLPRLLGSKDMPAPVRLSVEPGRISRWREQLAALGPAPYLGVTWRGGSKRTDPSEFAARGENPLYKEVGVEALARCVACWRGTVLVLQRGPQPDECERFSEALGRPAYDVSAVNEDLADMAALLSLIEEYVGVSNTNMHVRAGVGRTARILVPFPPEFRWMSSGDEVGWFPGFRVYRERPGGDWKPALEQLVADLTA